MIGTFIFILMFQMQIEPIYFNECVIEDKIRIMRIETSERIYS
jgi:hypothetical protein